MDATSTQDFPYRVRRLMRYTAVNLVSLVVDYAIFLSLTAAFALPVLASMVGYGMAFTLNYHLSRQFVFGNDGMHKGSRRLLAQFMATGVLGVALTAAVTGLGVYGLGYSPAIAKTAAVLICFVTLYVIRSRLVFNRPA